MPSIFGGQLKNCVAKMFDETKGTKKMIKFSLFAGAVFGVGIGLSVSAILPQPFVESAAVNVICESFVGPQGLTGTDGADGKDGLHGTVTFKHDPELLGLFSEQNVKIETQPID